ncbi:MAG: uncharacterized protein A8A55_2924 [Amphiamblys sp. WSBS2006]|nr:MAG: uncharacterized protein A8A55_2924 [Amphiamblys sp. WSBS2006]
MSARSGNVPGHGEQEETVVSADVPADQVSTRRGANKAALWKDDTNTDGSSEKSPERMRSRRESLSQSSEDGPKKKENSLPKTTRDSEKKPRGSRDDTAQLERIGYSCWMVGGGGRGCLNVKAAG